MKLVTQLKVVVIVRVAEAPQIAELGDEFSENDAAFGRMVAPVDVAVQEPGVALLGSSHSQRLLETGPLRREQDDEDEQHNGGLVDVHLLDAGDELHVHAEETVGGHVFHVVQFEDGRVGVDVHVDVGPAVVARVEGQGPAQQAHLQDAALQQQALVTE